MIVYGQVVLDVWLKSENTQGDEKRSITITKELQEPTQLMQKSMRILKPGKIKTSVREARVKKLAFFGLVFERVHQSS